MNATSGPTGSPLRDRCAGPSAAPTSCRSRRSRRRRARTPSSLPTRQLPVTATLPACTDELARAPPSSAARLRANTPAATSSEPALAIAPPLPVSATLPSKRAPVTAVDAEPCRDGAAGSTGRVAAEARGLDAETCAVVRDGAAVSRRGIGGAQRRTVTSAAAPMAIAPPLSPAAAAAAGEGHALDDESGSGPHVDDAIGRVEAWTMVAVPLPATSSSRSVAAVLFTTSRSPGQCGVVGARHGPACRSRRSAGSRGPSPCSTRQDTRRAAFRFAARIASREQSPSELFSSAVVLTVMSVGARRAARRGRSRPRAGRAPRDASGRWSAASRGDHRRIAAPSGDDESHGGRRREDDVAGTAGQRISGLAGARARRARSAAPSSSRDSRGRDDALPERLVVSETPRVRRRRRARRGPERGRDHVEQEDAPPRCAVVPPRKQRRAPAGRATGSAPTRRAAPGSAPGRLTRRAPSRPARRVARRRRRGRRAQNRRLITLDAHQAARHSAITCASASPVGSCAQQRRKRDRPSLYAIACAAPRRRGSGSGEQLRDLARGGRVSEPRRPIAQTERSSWATSTVPPTPARAAPSARRSGKRDPPYAPLRCSVVAIAVFAAQPGSR